jgi:hypothetical protein
MASAPDELLADWGINGGARQFYAAVGGVKAKRPGKLRVS